MLNALKKLQKLCLFLPVCIFTPLMPHMVKAETLTPLPTDYAASTTTQVVMLGTGTPFNDSNHLGQAAAIVVNESVYLVDFGPGAVRQIDAASKKGYKGFPGNTMRPVFLKKAFLTHLDSDHTTGLPDVILTPWVLGRKEPLEIYGPPRTERMVTNILEAYNTEIQHRLRGSQPANPDGYKVNVTTIREEGVIYKDENITVEAFHNRHGDWPIGTSLGFRFTTPDRVIVHSGDTTYHPDVVKHYEGADILIQSGFSMKGLSKRTKNWQKYHQAAHASSEQIADIGKQIKPKLLVLNHINLFGEDKASFIKDFSEMYNGDFVYAEDLDIY